MTSGPCMPMVLEKADAVAALREAIGATDPAEAAEGTVRKLYAESKGRNAIHASDSDENADARGALLLRRDRARSGAERSGRRGAAAALRRRRGRRLDKCNGSQVVFTAMLSFDIRSLEPSAPSPSTATLSPDDPVWEEGDPLPSTPVRVTGRLSAAGPGRFYFTARSRATWRCECRRCLSDAPGARVRRGAPHLRGSGDGGASRTIPTSS